MKIRMINEAATGPVTTAFDGQFAIQDYMNLLSLLPSHSKQTIATSAPDIDLTSVTTVLPAYKAFVSKCKKNGDWTQTMVIDKLGLTDPARFRDFLGDPIVARWLRTNYVNIDPESIKVVAAEKRKAAKAAEKEEKERARIEETRNRFITKITNFTVAIESICDFEWGSTLGTDAAIQQDLDFAENLMQQHPNAIVARSIFYPELPSMFIFGVGEGNENLKGSDTLTVNGEDGPQPYSRAIDYFYIGKLIEYFGSLEDVKQVTGEGFNPRWIPDICKIDYFIQHPKPTKVEAEAKKRMADDNSFIAGEGRAISSKEGNVQVDDYTNDEEEDLGMVESVKNDRRILAKLVESYGIEDVMAFVKKL